MLVDLLTCLGVPSSLVPASPLFFLVQVVIAVYVIRYIATYFQEEYTNVPEFKVETPKKEGGRYKPEMQQQNKDVIVCYNPATLELLGKAPVMSTAQVEAAVRKARDAQKQWKKTSFAERRRVMRSLVQFTVKNQQQMAEVSRDETGKTVFEGMMGEVYTTCGKVDYLISASEKILSPESRPSGLMMAHKTATVYYEPFGIIGIIIPWNFPVHNALSHISTALMAGNGCVVKVSEWASWSSIYLQRLVTAWLKSCGHNPDLVQFVTGYGETGSAVVSLSDKVLFIGSPEIGKRVMENASKTLTPVILELGGKDPYIVCEDADMSHAVNMAVRGSFFNCGQNCVSAERYYIFDKVYDQFVDGVMKQATKLIQGYDTDASRCDVGSINLPGQFEKYEALVKDAVAKGAQIKLGGKIRSNASGHFWEPTILVNVNHTMRIMREEIFGPIMCIHKVKSDEELIKLANDCEFGLGCSVFSADAKRAKRIATAVESGMCSVNDWGLFYAVISSPFGGFKKSGFGKFNGPEGLREFSVQKTLVADRFPFLVKPPAFMNYPVAKNAHLITEDMVKIIYENGIMNKVKASVSIVQRLLNK